MKLSTDLGRSSQVPAAVPANPAVGCEERDRILLSYMMVIERQNSALRQAEQAVTAEERAAAQRDFEDARGDSSRTRQLLLDHCQRHGC